MQRRNARILIFSGIALLVLLAVGRAAVELYTDALWYQSLQHLPVFTTQFLAAASVRATAGLVGACIVFLNLWLVARHLGPVHLRRRYGNLEIAEQVPRVLLVGGIVLTSVLAGWWLSQLRFDSASALAVFAWLKHDAWGVTDPLFHRDLSFFVFTLPVYGAALEFLFIVLVWTMMLGLLGYVLVGAIRWRETKLEIDPGPRFHFTILAAALLALIALRYWLSRYTLLIDGNGFNGATGYTDIAARLPGRTIMTFVALLACASLVYGAQKRLWAPPALGLGIMLVGALVAGQVYPSFVQKLRVEPNQVQRESPYIAWNMDFTLRAYGLDSLRREQTAYRRSGLTSWSQSSGTLSELPLWDTDPLRAAITQLQSIYGYYHFAHVDFDRYSKNGRPVQVAIAAREFFPQNLPEASRNWVTLHLNPKYTRGLGAVVTPANQVSADGEPVFWLKDLNSITPDPNAPPELNMRDARIYFGETTTGYVIVQPGRDSIAPPGAAVPKGVTLGSFGRLLSFAWRFGDKNLLFTGSLDAQSRVLFRRTLHERLEALAPFLYWDNDPYPVVYDGHLVWINDGYSIANSFPLAKPLQLEGLGRVRYTRNTAKAVIDAVTGEVRMFAADEKEPLLRTYRRVFPGLFEPLTNMPAALRAHLRYPPLYLQAQSEVLQEYHVDRPEAFLTAQDVWQIPQEVGTPGVPRIYKPIFQIMKLPNETQPEYVITMPFIARQRQNMTALLVGRSDGVHYGELRLIELPRDQQIPGPTQVQSLMEQDPSISPQLSLWRQGGSDVELGRLRIVPVDSAFLYVQPLFLSAPGSPIPELQRVIVSDGRAVSMAATFESAMISLGSPEAASRETGAVVAGKPQVGSPSANVWKRATDLMNEADKRLRGGDLAGFGQKWAELKDFLERSASGKP